MERGGKRVFELVFFPATLGVGLLCVWRVTSLPSQESTRILGWSAAGFAIAVALGWRVGQLSASRLRLTRSVLISVVFQGIVLLLLPSYICSHRLQGPPHVFLLEGMALLLVVAAVVSAAYLLGLLLLPGKCTLSRAWRIPLIILLYGFLLAGFFRAYSAYGYRLPLPEPLPPPEATYEVILEKFLQGFPPNITEKLNENGVILYEVSEREQPTLLRYSLECYGPFPESIIDVKGGRASVDGQSLELVDCHLRLSQLSDSVVEKLGVEGLVIRQRYGSPVRTEGIVDHVPGRAWLMCARRESAGFSWTDPWNLEIVFRWPEGLDILPVRIEPILLPSGTWVPSHRYPDFLIGRNSNGERLLVVRTGYGSLIPGPLELRMDLWHGDSFPYTLPPREGEILRTKYNAILLVKMYPGRFSLEPSDSGHHSLVASEGKGPATTAVFCAPSPPGVAGVCGIDAVGKNGEIYPGEYEWPERGLGSVIFGCGPEEIEEFRIVERTAFSRISYRISRLEELPKENIGCRNLLDLRIPRILLRPPCHPSQIVRLCLMGRPYLDLSSRSDPYRPFDGSLPADSTFRDVLNYSRGDSWDVRKGILSLGGGRFDEWKGGPFVGKILKAAQALGK